MGDASERFDSISVGGSSGVPGTFLVACTFSNIFRLSSLSARVNERGLGAGDKVLGVFVPEGPAMVAVDLTPDNTVPASEAIGESGNTVVKFNQLPSAS